jgi:GNAT superfamily N-acetyltransferase
VIQTRGYTAADAKDFLRLYRDCLRHYGIEPATPDQEARVLGILKSGRHMSCLMAYDGPSPVGFATWALTLPAAAGVALYMKEIFVRDTARGKGAGRALLAGLIQIAEDEGCHRFDWQTDGSNAGSQAFYAALDAPTHDKKSYRIAQQDYAKFRTRLGY